MPNRLYWTTFDNFIMTLSRCGATTAARSGGRSVCQLLGGPRVPRVPGCSGRFLAEFRLQRGRRGPNQHDRRPSKPVGPATQGLVALCRYIGAPSLAYGGEGCAAAAPYPACPAVPHVPVSIGDAIAAAVAHAVADQQRAGGGERARGEPPILGRVASRAAVMIGCRFLKSDNRR